MEVKDREEIDENHFIEWGYGTWSKKEKEENKERSIRNRWNREDGGFNYAASAELSWSDFNLMINESIKHNIFNKHELENILSEIKKKESPAVEYSEHTNFTIGAAELGDISQSSFQEFVSIIKGRSIISAADWGGTRFELGLSGNLMVRFFLSDDEITVNLLSTRNKGENPSLVINMGDMEQRIPVSVIATKLNALKTIYAIFYLIQDGREKELQSFLLESPQGDIERTLLKREEQLFIESISYGSWVMTIWGATKKSYRAIVSTAGLVFERGREAFLSKLEADARLKNAAADLKETEVREKEFDIGKKQFDYLMEASDKLDVPEAKELLKKRLIEATQRFTIGDKTDGQSFKKLL